MALLDQLKITNATPKRDVSPVGRFRRRLVSGIDLQIELANADAAGQTLHKTRQRWAKTGPGGAKELVEKSVRLKRWWWKDEAGKVFVTLQYGLTALEIAPGKKAVEIGAIAELPAKLTLLRDAVNAGELDRCVRASGADPAVPKVAKPATPSAPSGKGK